jgi:hypothetical protein
MPFTEHSTLNKWHFKGSRTPNKNRRAPQEKRGQKKKEKKKPKNKKQNPIRTIVQERKRRNENKSPHCRRTQSPAKLFSLSEDDPMHFQINYFDSFH